MKTKLVLFLVLLFLLNACYKIEKPTKPTNLISEDNMVNVLVDMAIMSSAKGVNKSKIEENGIVPDDYIYKKNNIDSITFVESNAYYAFDIKKYDAIYLRVKDTLSKFRDKYKAIDDKEKKEKEVKDSIKRAKINADKLERIKNKKKEKPVGNEGLIPLKKN